MTHVSLHRLTILAGMAVTVLALVFAASPAARAQPELVVHLADDSSRAYSVADIWIVDVGEALVINGNGFSDSFPFTSIRKVDFNYDPSSVNDPREATNLVSVLHLFQNQPNPFSARTEIRFQLPTKGRVAVRVWAADGSLIRVLLDEERNAGMQSVAWDGMDGRGRRLPSGVYFYSLNGPGLEEGRRLVLLDQVAVEPRVTR